MQKKKHLAFIGVLLLARVEKKLGFRETTIVLRPETNPFYKAAFRLIRFENI